MGRVGEDCCFQRWRMVLRRMEKLVPFLPCGKRCRGRMKDESVRGGQQRPKGFGSASFVCRETGQFLDHPHESAHFGDVRREWKIGNGVLLRGFCRDSVHTNNVSCPFHRFSCEAELVDVQSDVVFPASLLESLEAHHVASSPRQQLSSPVALNPMVPRRTIKRVMV